MGKEDKELFKRYVAVQYSGMYNMFVQGYEVMKLINCDIEDYFYILNNYSELKEKFKEEFEEGKRIGVEMCDKLHS